MRTLGISLALFCVFFCSCHNSNKTLSTSPVYYTDNDAVQLVGMASNHVAIDAPQHIEGTHDKKTFSMDGWFRMNDSLMNIILFSGFGNTLAEIKYTSDTIVFESSMMDAKKFKAEYIVADIQLCFFEMSVLKPHMEAYGFSLTETKDGDLTVRELKKDGKLIISIQKIGQETKLTNSLRNYSYTITTGQM